MIPKKIEVKKLKSSYSKEEHREASRNHYLNNREKKIKKSLSYYYEHRDEILLRKKMKRLKLKIFKLSVKENLEALKK